MTLTALTQLFADVGCKRLYAKVLSPNDNSKNQVYFGSNVEVLNIFPSKEVFALPAKNGPSFKATINFGWLQDSGVVAPAPNSQIILYAQYPEVRFSGFLFGCQNPPSALMASRLAGRILFLGVTGNGNVVGHVIDDKSLAAVEFNVGATPPSIGPFSELVVPKVVGTLDARSLLLGELKRINRLKWIDSKQLDLNGTVKPCTASQCGGYTLEAELGIGKNSVSEPDFHGWEVKQHSVPRIDDPNSGGAITLMTPEPTGGFYRSAGVTAFLEKYGYPDRNNPNNRINFGGVHRVGTRHSTTGLTMLLRGYDDVTKKIVDSCGGIVLQSDDGSIAAEWSYEGLLAHWTRKHIRAVYVPSQCQKLPVLQYCYGNRVRLAEHTNPLRLLAAMSSGSVYYDPGIKLVKNGGVIQTKRRSQFRVLSKHIQSLYQSVSIVDL